MYRIQVAKRTENQITISMVSGKQKTIHLSSRDTRAVLANAKQAAIAANAPKPPLVKHAGLLVAILMVAYVLTGIGAILYYMQTRCPYSSLTACEASNESSCGSPTVSSSDDCARFVNMTEPCYCKACKYCLTKEQTKHCETAAEERLELCRKNMQYAQKSQ